MKDYTEIDEAAKAAVEIVQAIAIFELATGFEFPKTWRADVDKFKEILKEGRG